MPGWWKDRHQVNECREIPTRQFYLGEYLLFK